MRRSAPAASADRRIRARGSVGLGDSGRVRSLFVPRRSAIGPPVMTLIALGSFDGALLGCPHASRPSQAEFPRRLASTPGRPFVAHEPSGRVVVSASGPVPGQGQGHRLIECRFAATRGGADGHGDRSPGMSRRPSGGGSRRCADSDPWRRTWATPAGWSAEAGRRRAGRGRRSTVRAVARRA